MSIWIRTREEIFLYRVWISSFPESLFFWSEAGRGKKRNREQRWKLKFLFQVGLHAPGPSSTGTTFLTQRWRRELMALRLVTTLSTSTSAVSAELVLLVSTPSLSLEVSWMSPSKIFLTFFSAWSSGNKSSEVMISLSSLIRIFFSFSCFYLFRFRGRVVRVLDLSRLVIRRPEFKSCMTASWICSR